MEQEEQVVEKLIEQTKAEDALPKRGVNQDLVKFMLGIASSIQSDSHQDYILYTTIKSLLRTDDFRVPAQQIPSTVFAYYIACKTEDPSPDPDHQFLLALISVFDMFIGHPKDLTLKQMVRKAAEGLQEVIVTRLAHNKTDFKKGVFRMGRLATIVESLPHHTRAFGIRANLPYITWVRDLFLRLSTEVDALALETDPVVNKVISQITKNKKYITV